MGSLMGRPPRGRPSSRRVSGVAQGEARGASQQKGSRPPGRHGQRSQTLHRPSSLRPETLPLSSARHWEGLVGDTAGATSRERRAPGPGTLPELMAFCWETARSGVSRVDQTPRQPGSAHPTPAPRSNCPPRHAHC